MRARILAAESLGVRSLAILVEAEWGTALVDPGVSLAPERFGLPPHPRELAASFRAREAILAAAARADIIILTHYHHDHFTPWEDRPYEWSDSDRAEAIYRGKRILAKDGARDLNYNQRRRAAVLFARKDLDVHVADGARFGPISFSPAVPHGERGSRQGFVVMALFEEGGRRIACASDIQCLDSEAIDWLIAARPDLAILSGPPTYHGGVPRRVKERGLAELARLTRALHLVIADHHFLRDAEYRAVRERAGAASAKSAAEYEGLPPAPLEAWRRRLYDEEPVPDGWHALFEAGDETIRREIARRAAAPPGLGPLLADGPFDG